MERTRYSCLMVVAAWKPYRISKYSWIVSSGLLLRTTANMKDFKVAVAAWDTSEEQVVLPDWIRMNTLGVRFLAGEFQEDVRDLLKRMREPCKSNVAAWKHWRVIRQLEVGYLHKSDFRARADWRKQDPLVWCFAVGRASEWSPRVVQPNCDRGRVHQESS